MSTLNLDKETRQLINDARSLGGKGVPVRLDDNELLRICAVVALDLNRQGLVDDIAPLIDAANGYYGTPLKWFKTPVPPRIRLDTMFMALRTEIADFATYFKGLCALHKRRIKFTRILEYQPIATMEQIVPRCLLEYGMRPSETLASWLLWRKWLYDIDNRSAQETGYLFEPILTSALDGVSYSAAKSPIKRTGDPSKGRQVDCLDATERLAYEFKMRVTIAPSGQGRFKEELDFALDCKNSGYAPILLVLDPTASPRLAELETEYQNHDGRAYIGPAAWQYVKERAAPVMAHFIDNYVRIPLQEVESSHKTLQPIHLISNGSMILVRVGEEGFSIPRPSRSSNPEMVQALADDDTDEDDL